MGIAVTLDIRRNPAFTAEGKPLRPWETVTGKFSTVSSAKAYAETNAGFMDGRIQYRICIAGQEIMASVPDGHDGLRWRAGVSNCDELSPREGRGSKPPSPDLNPWG